MPVNYFRWFRLSVHHIVQYLLIALVFAVLLGGLRFGLVLSNGPLWSASDAPALLESFQIGLRFDGRMIAFALLPVVFLPLFRSRMYERICVVWLSLFLSAFIFLGLLEIEFYREFQQRLNSLVIQYMSEDPVTVTGMIWAGYPVVTYLACWLLLSAGGFWLLNRLVPARTSHMHPAPALLVVMLLFVTDVAIARGTFRTGPPLRWGDAYHSDKMFLNHLALNGSFTLAQAVMASQDNPARSPWLDAPPGIDPVERTRSMVLVAQDTLLTPEETAVRRVQPAMDGRQPGSNIVVILMESFSGQYVGILGSGSGATPRFDELARQGVLFTQAFSNGTHTHQGIFATLSCFPNLPGYEYLMQTGKGQHQFSGLTKLLPDYQNAFVYNGDFSWDNQQGFFRNQGMQQFVGRKDYVNPHHIDPVWGVSDEDMFNRGLVELDQLAARGSFVSVLQTLSNHVPYSIPSHEEFEPVTNAGEMSDRLTAMKYSDWALGQFFDEARTRDWFDNTIFVVLGDHGFGTDHQLTEVNLLRFHVPLLFIAPGLSPARIDTVASQVDVVPSLLGLSGQACTHQCWGRNLFTLPEDDEGFAVIKPSGSEITTAILQGSHVLTWDPDRGAHLYQYQLLPVPVAEAEQDEQLSQQMVNSLRSYIATALSSLENNTTYATLH